MGAIAPTAGQVNTGGGGGGGASAGASIPGASGGSGIVIIRYPVPYTGYPAPYPVPEATGGTVTHFTRNGTRYRVHTFTNVGANTLNVTKGGLMECLVVAGGGGGGRGEPNPFGDGGGGGGAGGLVYSFASVEPGNMSVVVGAGGSGSTVNANRGNNGGNSVFGGLSAVGGGGGAGMAGTERIFEHGGSGGAGLALSISGVPVIYAGGGGGGGGFYNNGGNGGSGIVILRYPLPRGTCVLVYQGGVCGFHARCRGA